MVSSADVCTDVGINKLAAKNILRWRMCPELFAREALGFQPSNQQEQAYRELAKLITAKLLYRENLRREEEGEELLPVTEEQDKYIQKMGISIMSGKGTGKDAWMATLVPWFLICFSRGKIPMTGPSYDQLKDVLMPEISKWLDVRDKQGRHKCHIREMIDVKAVRVVRKDPDKALRAFAHIRTVSPGANEEQQKAVLGGWHEDYLMVLADEASGVPNGVFSALETTLTLPVNFAIIIFNPNKTSGFAYDTHYGKRKRKWIQLHWDSRKSSLVDPQQLQNMLDIYGRDGAEYRVFVQGLPPYDEPDTLIQRSWVLNSQERTKSMTNAAFAKENPLAPLLMGIDVARSGKDASVILTRRGRRVIDILSVHEPDSAKLADLILMKLAEYNPVSAYIDTIGLGGPVYDFVRKHWPRLRGVDVSRASSNSRCRRLRDALWWKLRRRFEEGTLDIPDNSVLRNELTSIKYETTEKGLIKVESKKKMRDRGMPSPNIADALMLTMIANDATMLKVGQELARDAYEGENEYKRMSGRGWMRR